MVVGGEEGGRGKGEERKWSGGGREGEGREKRGGRGGKGRGGGGRGERKLRVRGGKGKREEEMVEEGREGKRRGEERGELNNALQWILNCNYKVFLTCIFPHLVLSDDGLQWRLWKHLPVAEQVDTRQ